MELKQVVLGLRRFWLLILVFTCVSAATVGVFTESQSPMYTATAQGVVSIANPSRQPPYALASGAQYILDRMTSYAQLGVTTPVLQPVVDELELDETALTLSGRVSSHSIVGKAVLDVTVTYNDPRTAAAIADAVLAQLGTTIGSLERGNVVTSPIGPALPPTQPSNRNTTLNAAVAAAGGLVVGCFVAVGLQFFTERRRRRRELQ